MGLGLCFGRVTGLKGEGEMRKEKANVDENLSRVTKQKCSDQVIGMGPTNSVKNIE